MEYYSKDLDSPLCYVVKFLNEHAAMKDIDLKSLRVTDADYLRDYRGLTCKFKMQFTHGGFEHHIMAIIYKTNAGEHIIDFVMMDGQYDLVKNTLIQTYDLSNITSDVNRPIKKKIL